MVSFLAEEMLNDGMSPTDPNPRLARRCRLEERRGKDDEKKLPFLSR